MEAVADNSPQLGHSHDHGSLWIERQILETPTLVKAVHEVVQRMRDDADAADFLRRAQGRFQREEDQRCCVSPRLEVFVDRKLAQKHNRNRIRLIALLRFWQIAAPDLRGRERDKPRYAVGGIGDHVDSGRSGDVI